MAGQRKASTPSTYHHGNLREVLVTAAVAAVEQGNAQTLSMRELAVAAGVSTAAPYRHFADRAALLAAVVCAGYDDLLMRHAQVVQSRATPMNKLRRVMRDFLAFARERPGLFHLMYLQSLPETALQDPSVRALEVQTYEALRQALGEALPSLPDAELRQRLVTLWATLLGHAVGQLRHPLRDFMRAGLSDAQIDEAVLVAAVGQLPG
jgi:AcrR family transcriptional regulator